MATSVLNPNAPIFVPSVYRAVEDFSDQWWDLVQSSPWFRDYWLHECFSDPQFDSSPILEDDDDGESHVIDDDGESHVIDDGLIGDAVTEGKESGTDLVALGWLKWRKPRGEMEVPRYCDKAPKFVNMKVKPRAIQQPR